jgi:hypothetical protein
MAGVKITELPQLSATPDDNDVVIIVDTDQNVTKRITIQNLLASTVSQDEDIAAQTSTKIFIADVDSDAPYYPLFAYNTPTANAEDSVKADINFTYNPGTNVLSANFFSGNGSLLTDVTVDSAENATNALLANYATNAGQALTADSATIASSALHALTADSATNATNAVLAATATQSLGDLDNVIDSDTGARVLGDLTVDSDLHVGGILYGDGTGLTNITSTAVTTASEKIDAKEVDSSGLHYLMLRTLSTGYDSVSTTGDLSYDPATAILSASSFQGDGANLTNVSAVNSVNANNVLVSTVTDNTQYYLHFGSVASGNDNVNVNTGLVYNPSSNKLSSSIFSTPNWEVFEEAGKLLFSLDGVKKMRLDSSGNLAITGTLTESATL